MFNAEFEGERLGLWADSMRYQKRIRHLSEEQIERLEGLPGWAWTKLRPADQRQDMAPQPLFMATQRNWQRDDLRDPQAPGTECAAIDRWNGKQWLQRFVRTNDNSGWVPADEPTEGCQLGESGTISVVMPSKLGRGIYRWCDLAYEECYVFEFDGDFRRMLRLLTKWADEAGDTDVPIDTDYKGVHLGLWVGAMRYRYDHGTLQPEAWHSLKPCQVGDGAPTPEFSTEKSRRLGPNRNAPCVDRRTVFLVGFLVQAFPIGFLRCAAGP